VQSTDQTPEPYPPGTIAAYFSAKEKRRRALWYLVQATLFRFPIRRADRWRASLLRCFGATIGRHCLIRRTVHVEIPWTLKVGDRVLIGDHAILYSLGPITIGDRAMISQHAHLCAGSHDYRTGSMTLLRIPITIGADAWIAADAFIGPGVTIGEGTVVGARSSVFKDLPAWKVCAGSPARVLHDRPFDPRGAPPQMPARDQA
jgi:putative colanic acid biosynthesis acetyltransferase WcaF